MLNASWQDDEGTHEVHITGPRSQIGRGPDADLRLANPSVSRRHAVLTETPSVLAKAESVWVLQDLESQNGTTIDGQLVREHVIDDGDTILFGEVQVRFVLAVDESIRLNTKTAAEEARPGSVTMSANDVVSGKAVNSRSGQVIVENEVAAALSRLADVARNLLSATTLPALFERVLDVVLENTPVEHVFLLLYDPFGNQLVPKTSRSRNGEESDFLISRGISRFVFNKNESILTLDAADDPRFTGDSIGVQGLRSVMCAPLFTQGNTLGVIFTGSPQGGVALEEQHLHLLTVIANLAAVAIDQTQLRARVQQEFLLRSRLTRYQSSTLVDELLSEPDEQSATVPREREVSVLFADIAGFSTRTEQMAPTAVARLLNSLFSEMVEIVFAHHGTLDKFLGDGLMAIFGAPNELPDHARSAVECALSMQERMRSLDIREGGTTPIQIRIGINSGPVVAGDIGSDRRVEYTVLGNTVNVAARLEANVARPGETVIGPDTKAALPEEISIESLGPKTLKGIQEPVEVFRAIG